MEFNHPYFYFMGVFEVWDYHKCTSNGKALQLHKVYFTASQVRIHIRYWESCENSYQVLRVMCAVSEHAMKLKICIRNHYHRSSKLQCVLKLLFTAVGVVTHAVHSYMSTIQWYRRQQTRDVFPL